MPAPGHVVTRIIGTIADIPVPRPLRSPLWRAWAGAVGARLDEAETSPDEWATFGAVFMRDLTDGARPLAEAGIVAPSDGVVTDVGTVHPARQWRVKGASWRLDDLIGPLAPERFAGGQACVIYLGPSDPHSVHAPFDATVERVIHRPGDLHTVRPETNPRLDAHERVIFAGTFADGEPWVLVMVAAVGVRRVDVAPSLQDVASDASRRIGVRRGQRLATFGLGSTVVLAVGPGASLAPTDGHRRVLRGQRLGEQDSPAS
jgi:phosphatidylserine decarboxylase